MRQPTTNFRLLWLSGAILCAAASFVVAEQPTSVEQLVANAIQAGKTRDVESVASLVKQLGHESPIVRQSCAWALSQLGSSASEAVPALARALGDSDSRVRWAAAVALGKAEPPAKIAETALWKATLDRNSDVRCAALIALRAGSTTNHSEALSALCECLGCAIPEVQSEAIATASTLQSKWDRADRRAIVPPLTNLMANGSSEFRLAVAVLLSDLGLSAAEGLSALASATNDPDEHVQAAAARALERFADEVDQRWTQLDTGQRLELCQCCEAAAQVLKTASQKSVEVAELANDFERLISGMKLDSADEVITLQRVTPLPVSPSSGTQIKSSASLLNDWRWIFAAVLVSIGLWGLRHSLSGKSASPDAFTRSAQPDANPLGELGVPIASTENTISPNETMNSLADIAPDAVSPFVKALRDDDGRVRQAAAIKLGQIGLGAIDSVPHLILALEDTDPCVRAAVAFALSAFGPHAMEAVPALRAALADVFAPVRARAAFALGQIGLPARRAAEELARLVSDPDVSVRRNSASALGGIGADSAVVLPALRQAVEDADAGVRRCASTTLAMIEPQSDSGSLRVVADSDPAVPELKLFCPDQPDTSDAVSLSEPPLDVADFIARLEDTDADIRWQATQSLAQLGASAVSELIASLNHRNPTVRRLLIVALGHAGAEAREAMPALLVALHDVNSDVRCAAVDCLGQLGFVSRSMVQALVQSLTDPNSEVRRYAATTLGRFGQQALESTTALQIASISDVAAKVRTAAHAAHRRISDSLAEVA